METVNLVIVGLGKVGRALVREILSTPLKDRFRITALFDRSGGLVDENGLDENLIREAVQVKEKGRSLAEMRVCGWARPSPPLPSPPPHLPNLGKGEGAGGGGEGTNPHGREKDGEDTCRHSGSKGGGDFECGVAEG